MGDASQTRSHAPLGPPEELIVFLCPNGHKLNGPRALQGKSGKCPHCAAKFRIPDAELGAPEGQQRAELLGEGVQDDAVETDRIGRVNGELELAPLDDEPPHDPRSTRTGHNMPGLKHPLARLFVKLWQEKQLGATVELQLEGAKITPDWWSCDLSDDQYGVFALQSADGNYVMETVPWDAVRRISVRNITELPDEGFQ